MGEEFEELEEGQPDIYNELANKVPEREVEMPEDGDKHKSLDEAESEDPGLSDFQVALRRLFPDFGDKIHNAMMMARVAPDMFIPLVRIMVNSAIKRMDPHQPINVADKAALYYILCSIGLDGKGRIDTIEMSGKGANDDDEMEKLAKSMGSGGAF